MDHVQPRPDIDNLISVTSHDYLPGTLVMLHSFASAHRWFDGSIVLLEDDLTPDDKAQISSAFPAAIFERPCPDLMKGIETLTNAVPKLKNRARRFFSLEAFNPSRTGRTLFCDGDLLFRAGIDAMLAKPGALVACADRAQLQGGNDAHPSFNAGLMVIGDDLRTTTNWSDLLGQLSGEKWAAVKSQHTDQAVLGSIFGDQVTLADSVNNFLVGHAATLREAAGSPISEAKVLHFNGPAKPWRFDAHLDAAQNDASFVKAAGEWFAAYQQFLAAYHFASRKGNLPD